MSAASSLFINRGFQGGAWPPEQVLVLLGTGVVEALTESPVASETTSTNGALGITNEGRLVVTPLVMPAMSS